MAETDMAKLSPASGMDRVEGGQSNAWAHLTTTNVVRHDPTLNVPLYVAVPGQSPPVPEPPQSPPKPLTEAQRREVLRVVIEARKATEDAAKAASEALSRAREHRAACASELAKFDDLEAQISDATVAGLRSATGRPDLSAFTVQISAREVAQTTLTAADAALVTLAHDHEQATARVQSVQGRERVALTAVLELERNRLRGEQRWHEQQAAAYAQLAGWSDTHEKWQAVAKRLTSDPLRASIDIGDVPEEPVKEPPKPTIVQGGFDQTVTDARTGEVMDAAEAFRRMREQRQKETVGYAIREAQARALAHGIPGIGGSNIGRG
jgi:hypothetical protein